MRGLPGDGLSAGGAPAKPPVSSVPAPPLDTRVAPVPMLPPIDALPMSVLYGAAAPMLVD